MKIVNKACALGGLTICTPSYTTNEGALSNVESPEAQLKMAKGFVWVIGIVDYIRYLKNWRAQGNQK